jgi:hypothetical protein
MPVSLNAQLDLADVSDDNGACAEAALVEIARRHKVWPFVLMEAAGLQLFEGCFYPREEAIARCARRGPRPGERHGVRFGGVSQEAGG